MALFPSLATTETNWQAEKALSKLGQVGKFVIDDENQTIRLPAVVNSQGLLGLSGIGNLVNESLPNITAHTICDLLGTDQNTGAFYNITSPQTTNYYCSPGTNYRTYFDASHSSSTYQDDAPVQQEAVQYPYYIQVATGIQEELPAIREYKINTPFFFGWSRYFENAPYNASLLASQGQYNASSMYPDLWAQLTGVELNSSLNVGDTIEIGGKTYVKRGLPVVLSTDTYTDYDFVVDQDNSRFRLPLLNGEEDLPGNTYEEITLLPTASIYETNKNGWYNLRKTSGGVEFGLLYNESNMDIDYQVVEAAGREVALNMYAKKGQKVDIHYNLTGTTTWMHFIPAIGNGTLYYYVGDTVQDASLINAGAVLNEVVNLKANKADINASNFNTTGKETIVGWGMPDYSAGVALSPSTLTTITTKGWINYTSIRTNAIGGVTVSGVLFQSGSSATNDRGSMMIPVDVGDTVQGVGGGSDTVTFYPCKGV